ncbi:DNA-binding GntR family transcriptional regulator [Arthrobacter sp. GAS37]|uniref:GntR family transcriptional regulator n=1 Tax=Arthrobacter sp. GAS37 TaxID=3156261 RepID=UPI0038399717
MEKESHRTGGERVRDQIRLDILNGRWGPGTKLQPASLAVMYDTSTTVIREALTRLTGENMISVEPNRGFFVQQVTFHELADLTELRCRIEAFAVELAVERGDLVWESNVIASHHTLSRTPRRNESDPEHVSEAWAVAHRAFHAKLLEACGVPMVIDLSRQLSDFTEIYRRWAAPSTAATARDVEREHVEILNAVLERDAQQAAALLRAHYERTVQVLLESGIVRDDGAKKLSTSTDRKLPA